MRESPLAILSALDVGCWNGTLGKALANVQGLHIDGIERDEERARQARQAGYRMVYCMDLNRDTIRTASGSYDFVFLGDVLEHLIDPPKVLQEARDLLTPTGKIMLSIPNIAFFTCRLTHLLGLWNYADYGIMDRTHLRFFTKKTLLKMLQECEYELEWIEGYVGLSGYPRIVREPLRWLGRIWPSLFAIQLVAAATVSSNAAQNQLETRGMP